MLKTEERKEEEDKDIFYKQLDILLNQCLVFNIKRYSKLTYKIQKLPFDVGA